MSVLRRSYHFESWKGWDHQIHLSVLDFFNAFKVYPNILLANSITFSRMDIVADKEKIEGPEGKAVGKYEVVSMGGFSTEDYALEFCFEEKLSDKSFSLIYDADPNGDGGEPVPEKDTETEEMLRESGRSVC